MAARQWSGKTVSMVLAVLVAAGSLGLIQPAVADSGADLVEACQPLTAAPEIGPRACRGVQGATFVPAQGCRREEGLRDEVCPTIDGRRVSEAAMAEFENSWLARALALQSKLDLKVPLAQALIPHTHNSANSSAYAPSVTTLDANQVLTITDQLRIGMRAIEIDVHWTQHPNGDPAHQMRAVVQCHAEPVDTTSPAGVIHGGCSVDTLLVTLLTELRAWLDDPANDDEVVLLYLENALDNDPAAHDAAAAAIDGTLGNLVARPTAGAGCQGLPVSVTKQQLLTAGTRVLITGNCGPGGWNNRVFDRSPDWNESGGSTFDCTATRASTPRFDSILVRRYEDSTWLSAMAGTGSHISPATMAEMVRCGVNLVGFDQLTAGDDRLPSLVWSWRTNEPAIGSTTACAAQGGDGHFFADSCNAKRRIACRTAAGGWAVTAEAEKWSKASSQCAKEGFVAAGVPANGWDNGLLRVAADKAGAPEVWLAYGQDASGGWATGIPIVARPKLKPTHPDNPERPERPEHPAAGHGHGKPIAATHALPGMPPGIVEAIIAAGLLVGGARVLRRRRAAQ